MPSDRTVVTAVGRLLQPKNGEPRRYHRIRVDAEGKVTTVVRRDLPAMSSLEWRTDTGIVLSETCEAVVPIGEDGYLTISADPEQVSRVPAALAALPEVRAELAGIDRLSSLRRRLERIIAAAQSERPQPGHIELADRLLDAVLAWQGEVQP